MVQRSTGEEIEARAAVVLGALVADAAAMGLHWLYDADRLAEIAARREPVFLDADQRHFEGVQGYFAHEGKQAGELSQYGATLTLAMASLIATGGRFAAADYQKRYLAFFGPGGSWKGYIDRPTRGTLANLGSAIGEDTPEVSGVDDDQLPALSPVPALVAAGPDAADLEQQVTSLVRVTNDNPLALEAALITARLIRAMLAEEKVSTALEREAEHAGEVLQPLLRKALASKNRSSVDLAGDIGRACHVQQGLPVVFHIVSHASSFREATRSNVLAGGDSCGRSMALGALLGARFGFGGEHGIPLPWLTRVAGGARLFDQAYQLAAL
ncbi:MAG: ADP-ribosylglycohydrolase family protein [Alphaproteobacteria bacterium]